MHVKESEIGAVTMANKIVQNGRTNKDYAILITNSNTMKEFTCGWGAAFINITVTYPIYKVMFRQVGNSVDIR